MESATTYFINEMTTPDVFYSNHNGSIFDSVLRNITQRTLSEWSRNLTLRLYLYVVPILIFTCFVSFVVNLKILVASKWLRRPISPILKISLSMAGADAFTSMALGIGLLVNSWIPILKMEESTNLCPMLTLEGLRLGGILSVVFHILFLSTNHYAGIVKPLHYQGIITGTYTNFILVAIWIIPPSSLLIYFNLIPDDGYNRVNCSYDFLRRWNFRATFFGLFLAPFVVMLYIYMHVFVIVRRHQQIRARFTRGGTGLSRTDSTGIRNTTLDLQRNMKAIWTTLLMLGSYLVGWLPGLAYFIIVCDDCYYSLYYFNPLTTFSICVVTNLFIILKTVFNPLIYATRIADIKVANMKMYIFIRNVWKNGGIPRQAESRVVFRMQDYPVTNTEYTEAPSTSRML